MNSILAARITFETDRIVERLTRSELPLCVTVKKGAVMITKTTTNVYAEIPPESVIGIYDCFVPRQWVAEDLAYCLKSA